MASILLESLRAWWPEAILSAGALLVILLGATRRAGLAWPAAWVILAASAAALWRAPVSPSTGIFFDLIICDAFSVVFRWISVGMAALILLMSKASSDLDRAVQGEYVGIVFGLTVGLMLMAEATHLLMAYLAIEVVSLSSYVLVGWRRDARSAEASLKYLLFGALSSAIMLFGMSLLFGFTGELSLAKIADALSALSESMQPGVVAAATLLLAGLAFKISMVPFHMWTPDAYEGAPVPVAALLSVGPKAAGLALLLRFMEGLRPLWPTLEPVLLLLTVVTMTLGNLVALAQTNVKRLLAYSTIGQVGYVLIGVVVNSRLGLEALLVYLVAYVFMNLGAFACVVAVVRDTGSEALEAFRGLAGRSPLLAFMCAVFLLSLAGIPPLLGFFGKFLLLGAAIEARAMELAIAGIVNSAIALYYYVNLIRLMYLAEPGHGQPVRADGALRLALALCLAGTLALGLFPGSLLTRIRPMASVILL